jgi:hypothetical protein
MGGITLNLSGTDIFGNPVSMSVTTAINGQYKFNGLPPGNYTVTVLTPLDFDHSPADACGTDFKDSDFNSSGVSGTITIAEGQCYIGLDAGLFNSCLNVSSAGTICCNQVLCGPGVDPAPITSTSPASGGGGPIQYMWMSTTNLNGGVWSVIPGATGLTYDPGPLSQTTYFRRCAQVVGCEAVVESNIITITVDDIAVAEITDPGMICVGDPVTFVATPNPGDATYFWDFGLWATPATSDDSVVVVTWTQFGVVNVTLTVVNNGCTSTAVLPVAVSDSPVYCNMNLIAPNGQNGVAVLNGEEAQFVLYPNPATDRFTIEYNDAVETAVSLEILGMDGRQLERETLQEGTFSHTVDLSGLLPGTYMIRLTFNEGERKVMRLVKN